MGGKEPARPAWWIILFAAVLTVLTVSCSESHQSSTILQPTVLPDQWSNDTGPIDDGVEVLSPLRAVVDSSDEPLASESDAGAARLMPDPERWVVVDDWSSRGATTASSDDVDGLQLDVAPLDEVGVPQLGRRISLNYRLGAFEDFDRQWGDASSMGEPVDFVVGEAVGRSVQNAQMGLAMAMVWYDGTFVSIQTQDPDADVTELATSLAVVDEGTWAAARRGAEAQRLVAVEAAMQNIAPVTSSGEPLPHWVLPAPWELEWVTDKTIWTPEQQAQAVGFSEANRPPTLDAATGSESDSWRFGFADSAEAAATQFVPQVTIYVNVFADAPDDFYPINYETVSALGLDGVITPVGGSGMSVELGTGKVRVGVLTTSELGEEGVREFLDAIEFASDDPLGGFVVSDPRFQPIDLADWDQRPVSWHAAWKRPDGPDGFISVWRLTVPELRVWMLGRGDGLPVPDDAWEIVAADGVIEFGPNTSYNASTGLLMSLRGIEQDDLVPLELEDWISLAAPLNTDPLNPR